MLVPNRNYSSPSYRYGFNGMEKDDEVSGNGNSVDFGVRMYDPRIARLKSVDPNAKELPNFSPYQYSRNNPIMLKENGMDGVIPPWLWRNYPWLISPVHAGFIDAIADDAVGLFDVVKTAQAFNPGMPFFYTSGGKQVRAETIETTKLVFEIVNDPVIRALVLAQVEADIKEKIINAEVIDYQYATGYATWNVLSMFIGVGEISALVKTGKLSRRTVRLLEKFKKLKPCGCFISGTQVLTKEGYKNIEDIVEGDLVWAYDDKTDDLALKKVLSTFTKEFEQVYKIYFGNEVLEATHEHPFFIGGKWLKVDELKQGDLLTLYDGTEVAIDKIEIVNGNFNVYNFEVEDYHSYYVSKNNVLVHNGVPCDPFRLGYKFKKGIDLDWRKTGKNYRDALTEVFDKIKKKTGVDKDNFNVTKWGKTKDGKSIPVEYQAIDADGVKVEVNIDFAHKTEGTLAAPHVGYKFGKKSTKEVGHIILKDVPAGRTDKL